MSERVRVGCERGSFQSGRRQARTREQRRSWSRLGWPPHWRRWPRFRRRDLIGQ
ncbi:MAG TPA: hypothetical protein VGL68_04055 [Solirubrobacteraceae bacterium]